MATVSVAIHNAVGKILRVVMCHEDDIDLQYNEANGESYTAIDPASMISPNTHIIEDGVPVTKPFDLTVARAIQDQILSSACSDEIIGGFVSGDYTYPSLDQDQNNLTQTVSTGGMVYRVPTAGGNWEFASLSASDVLAVLTDFIAHRDAARSKLLALRASLAEASTEEEVASIAWVE